MLKSIILALSVLVVTPLAVQASEITLIPAVKLQIGDQDNYGNHWDGGHWRDHGWWDEHYEWREHRWHPHEYYERHDEDHHHHHDDEDYDKHWKHH